MSDPKPALPSRKRRRAIIEAVVDRVETPDEPLGPFPDRPVAALCAAAVAEDEREEAAAGAVEHLLDAIEDPDEMRAAAPADLVRHLRKGRLRDPRRAAERVTRALRGAWHRGNGLDLSPLVRDRAAIQSLSEALPGLQDGVRARFRALMGAPAAPLDRAALRCARRLQVVDEADDAGAARLSLEDLLPQRLQYAAARALAHLGHGPCRPTRPHCRPCPARSVCAVGSDGGRASAARRSR